MSKTSQARNTKRPSPTGKRPRKYGKIEGSKPFNFVEYNEGVLAAKKIKLPKSSDPRAIAERRTKTEGAFGGRTLKRRSEAEKQAIAAFVAKAEQEKAAKSKD